MPEPIWNVDVPALPAGYMYRLRRKAFGYVTVEVRKKRVFGSKQLSRVVLLPHDFYSAEAMVVEGCRLALDKAPEHIAVRALLKELDSYVGDHLSLEDQ
jgi:hypothetical protein